MPAEQIYDKYCERRDLIDAFPNISEYDTKIPLFNFQLYNEAFGGTVGSNPTEV